jgi:hypothetical protein
MSSYNQIQNQWKDTWKWVKESSNCKEEQECDITSKMFIEPVEPLFKVKVHYTIDIWETGNYYSFMFIKRKGLLTQIGEAKRLFSLPKTIKLFSI